MKREDFIKAIEARGFWQTREMSFFPAKGHVYNRTVRGGCWSAVVGTTRASIDGKKHNSFALRYEHITEDLITAVAGPERSEE